MTEKEDLKGRAKEAAGAIKNDEDLKNEGKKDQSAGKTKQKVREAEEKSEEFIDRARDKF